jgi:hypothetical protein
MSLIYTKIIWIKYVLIHGNFELYMPYVGVVLRLWEDILTNVTVVIDSTSATTVAAIDIAHMSRT